MYIDRDMIRPELLPEYVFDDIKVDVFPLNESIFFSDFEVFFRFLLGFSKSIQSREILVQSFEVQEKQIVSKLSDNFIIEVDQNKTEIEKLSLPFDINLDDIFDLFYVWTRYYDVHENKLLLGNITTLKCTNGKWSLYFDGNHEFAMLAVANSSCLFFDNYLKKTDLDLTNIFLNNNQIASNGVFRREHYRQAFLNKLNINYPNIRINYD
jgi:hypothetical protein